MPKEKQMKRSIQVLVALGMVCAMLGVASLVRVDDSTAWSSSYDASLSGNGAGAPAIQASLGGITLYLPIVMRPPGPIFFPLVGKAATPTRTPTPTRTLTPIANPIKNGGFETANDATGPWLASLTYVGGAVQGVDLRDTLVGAGATPHTGSYAAWFGSYPFGTAGYQVELWQNNVTVPAGGSTLRYWLLIKSDEPQCSVDYDYTWVFFVTSQANQVESYPLCTSARTNGWIKRDVSLSSYVGQTGWLGFIVRILGANSDLFIDDVALGTLTGAPLPAQIPLPAGSRTPTP